MPEPNESKPARGMKEFFAKFLRIPLGKGLERSYKISWAKLKTWILKNHGKIGQKRLGIFWA
jgi:hypothetical protein